MTAPTPSFDRVAAVFHARDATRTVELYNELKGHGAEGLLAVNLCRAAKNSGLAKQYRGRNAKSAAYPSKRWWAIEQVEKVLADHAERLGIAWGWKRDPAQPRFEWVLYVELATGQVSFHGDRGNGPDFAGDWDRQGMSAERIIAFAAHTLDGTRPVRFGPPIAPPAVPVPDRRAKPRQVDPPGDDEPPLPLGLPV